MPLIGLAVALAVGLALAPLAAEAQEAGKVWRIGLLSVSYPSDRPANLEALRAALRDLGYVEGKNIVIEYRWAEGKSDRLPGLVAELVALKVDVIVTVGGTPPVLAAKQATTTIPIITTGVGDAVGAGLVSSLARPGGNVTGLTDVEPELAAKRIELLKEVVPRAGRVAVLDNSNTPILGVSFKAMEVTARSLKVELQKFNARGPTEFVRAFSTMTQSRIDAVVVAQNASFTANARAIAELATKKRLPSAGNAIFAQEGGSIGYGVNFLNSSRRAAYFVDKILKGAKPGDLPVEQASKFELVINMKTAKALGLTIPQSLLLRADQVIE
jgi:putative ABC transport system substrate-binding protein